MRTENLMKETILSILKRSDYINRATLLNEIRALGIYVTDRSMRREIESMVSEGIYIQSSELGYKLCRNPKDFVEAKNYLRKKAVAILRRCSHFDKGMRGIGQLQLL